MSWDFCVYPLISYVWSMKKCFKTPLLKKNVGGREQSEQSYSNYVSLEQKLVRE